jgi:hypothetical protein
MKSDSERQQARRIREKKWLKDHGFTSWEQLHTQLMNGDLTINTTLNGDYSLSLSLTQEQITDIISKSLVFDSEYDVIHGINRAAERITNEMRKS